MESTQQDSGGAARHKRRRGDSFQGACGPARTSREFDQCALANEQRDGDCPIQSIVTGLSGERITNGLVSFIVRDNHCAVELHHLRKGQRPFKVKTNENMGTSG